MQYREDSPTAILDRVEMVFSRPVPLFAFSSYYYLGSEKSFNQFDASLFGFPEFTGRDAKGRRVDYYGSPNSLVVTYSSDTPFCEVGRIAHYSRELYESVTRELQRSSTARQGCPVEAPTLRIPSLRADVTSLRFYNRGQQKPPLDQRKYSIRFSQSEARWVFWELHLTFPKPGRNVPIEVEYVLYRGDGTEFDRATVEHVIESDWPAVLLPGGTGWPQAGKWAVGKYWSVLFVQGRKIAAGSFEIY